MHAAERTRGEFAFGVFFEDFFGEAAALGGAAVGGTDHFEICVFSAVVEGDVDEPFHAWCDAGIGDGFFDPIGVFFR